MATTGLVMDELFQQHVTGPGHPECPQRLAQIQEVLTSRGLADRCERIEPKPIDPDSVLRTHTGEYVERLAGACASGESFIDTPDSAICRASHEIASLAAGSVLEAVDAVMAKRVRNAFCAIRPPGHHAERDRSMGFCLFANVAIAVDWLRERHGIGRVLILDWDVHHGNGTQHVLEADPEAMFISIHGHPDHLYPGTGFAEERGIGHGEGLTLNVPMMPGVGDDAYRDAFDRNIRRVLDGFKAEFILISAGFDAHRQDPLAPINLETDSFGWMTELLLDAADGHCDGRVVSVLEGGYDLDSLAESVALHVDLLLSRTTGV